MSSAPDAGLKQATEVKRLLKQAADDLDRSLAVVVETCDAINDIETRITELALIESGRRDADKVFLHGWYADYATWLEDRLVEFEEDFSRVLAGDASTDWTNRYGTMASGYRLQSDRLKERVHGLKTYADELREHIFKRQGRLEHLNLIAEEEMDAEEGSRTWLKRLENVALQNQDEGEYENTREETHTMLAEAVRWDVKPAEASNMTKEERDAVIVRLQKETVNFGAMANHLDVLIELGQNELDWISLKIDDCAALSEFAKVVGSAEPAFHRGAYADVIRTYNSDIAAIRKKIEESGRQWSNLARSSSVKETLDRAGLGEFFEQRKTLYHRRIEWLQQQIGSYQAELNSVFQAKDRNTISFPRMIEDIKTADIILVAVAEDEPQKDPERPSPEFEIVKALREAGASFAIGLDIFGADSQTMLDAWIEGYLSLDQNPLLYLNEPRSAWSLYQEILMYAREHGIPLLGLNVREKTERTVLLNGFGWLGDQERKLLSPEIDCSADQQYRQFLKNIYSLDEITGRTFLNFCEAHTVSDTFMAGGLVDYMNTKQGEAVVMLAGVGHAARRGIPERVSRRSEFSSRIILPRVHGRITSTAVKLIDADYVSYR